MHKLAVEMILKVLCELLLKNTTEDMFQMLFEMISCNAFILLVNVSFTEAQYISLFVVVLVHFCLCRKCLKNCCVTSVMLTSNLWYFCLVDISLAGSCDEILLLRFSSVYNLLRYDLFEQNLSILSTDCLYFLLLHIVMIQYIYEIEFCAEARLRTSVLTIFSLNVITWLIVTSLKL